MLNKLHLGMMVIFRPIGNPWFKPPKRYYRIYESNAHRRE